MSEYYTLVQEGLDQWINSPDNGGECCQTSRETVDELNRLINRIKRLEESENRLLNWLTEDCPDSVKKQLSNAWIKYKEAKP